MPCCPKQRHPVFAFALVNREAYLSLLCLTFLRTLVIHFNHLFLNTLQNARLYCPSFAEPSLFNNTFDPLPNIFLLDNRFSTSFEYHLHLQYQV